MIGTALALALAASHPGHADWRRIEIVESPAPLSERFEGARIGGLRLVSSFALTAEDEAFGGYSGLSVSADGARLLAVSDDASWLRAEIIRDDAGAISDLTSAYIAPITDADGHVFERKEDGDAEGLVVVGDEAVVSFERRHRIQRHSLREGDLPHTATIAVPESLASKPSNSGVESLEVLPDGRYLLLAERLRPKPDFTTGWIGGPGGWETFAYRPEAEHSPTDMALSLDGKHAYVVERAYSRAKGVRARIVHIALHDVISGSDVEGVELMRFERGVPIDNFEALAVAPGPDGRERLYLMSDDNFSSIQRTLLLEFEVVD